MFLHSVVKLADAPLNAAFHLPQITVPPTPSHVNPSHVPPHANTESGYTPPVVDATNPLQTLEQTHPDTFDDSGIDQPIFDPPPPEIELGDGFPVDRLSKLDEQLSRPKWVVPVRPGDDLEMLLRYSIKLCREGECVGGAQGGGASGRGACEARR